MQIVHGIAVLCFVETVSLLLPTLASAHSEAEGGLELLTLCLP